MFLPADARFITPLVLSASNGAWLVQLCGETVHSVTHSAQVVLVGGNTSVFCKMRFGLF